MFSLLVFSLVFLGVAAERVAVVQIFRHGERTPTVFYPNDPYKDSDVWQGLELGQLTITGKRQHFALGEYTRQRYSDLIPENYSSSFFRAETTDVDRTHMSAQANVYGIFPATGNQVWQENLKWQPIPIHPSNESIWSSSYYPKACGIILDLIAEILNSEEYQKLNEKYASTYKILSENSGEVVKDIVGAMNLWDPLKSEDSIGLHLPEWTKEVYPEPLRTLAGYAFEVTTHTTEMKRMVVGPFLNEIVNYFTSIIKNPTSTQKYKIYSGHDTNIASVLNSLGAFNPPRAPEFASSIYFELYHENPEYFVKVFSKEGDVVEQISVNGCDLNCSLSEFIERISDITVDASTRDVECEQLTSSRGIASHNETELVTNLRNMLKNGAS